MASSLPADILAEMKGQDRIHVGIEIDVLTAFGTTTTLKYSGTANPLNVNSIGTFKPYITGLNLPSRSADVVDFSLALQNGSVTFEDRDREMQYALGGASKSGLRGNAIRAKLVSEVGGISPFTIVDGVVTNYGSSGGKGTAVYQVDFAPRVKEFDASFKLPLFSKDLFANIPQRFRDTDSWLLYGQHKTAAGTGGNGMVSAVALGEADMWATSVAEMEGVDAAFVGGVAAAAADWTHHTIGRGPHIFHVVRWTANAPDPDADTVTFDGRGVTDSSTGGGTMISNPIEIMRHAIGNFAYGAGTTAGLAAWDDETTIPMATTILDTASTFYGNINAIASAQIFASDKPRNFIKSMCEDWGAVPFFTIGQEFALQAEDSAETELYLGEDAHIAERLGHVLEYKGSETARQAIETHLHVSRVLNRANNSFAETFDVADRDVMTKVVKDFQIETSRASLF